MFKQLIAALLMCCGAVHAAQNQVKSPDGKIILTLSDHDGLNYGVSVDGKTTIERSRLGLEFEGEQRFGPTAILTTTRTEAHKSSWENGFGKRRIVSDQFNELRVTVRESKQSPHFFGVVARVYNDGVAFRYDLPAASGLGNFVLTKELTEFRFAGDYQSWLGNESVCAESQYPQRLLSQIPVGEKGVLPLLVESPRCFVAFAESDLLNWAGMFLSGTGSSAVTATLAGRSDGKGKVSASVPCVSPWRVLMIGRKASDLIGSDLIANLATPNKLGDISWVKPGVCAWDSWWMGVNPYLPQFTGLDARGNTESHKEYIDFASEMGWSYQLIDWFWYKDDPTQPLPHVNIHELVSYARRKNVKLFLWMHSKDLTRVGFDKVFATVAAWGFVGVKVDFMDSDSQETVQWYVAALESAARYKLMVDFHGAYKPTGLARTYPNFITQEGVLGNEYNKIGGAKCTPLHTVTLPFTRGLLGPMDFTPGGFLNRTPYDFKTTFPTQVMGTRARQLAMTVVYESPLLVMCDSPTNYRGQPGIEFLRGLPTVWDETVVLTGQVGQTVALARRSGERWYLAAINSDVTSTFDVPLKFLGMGKWTLRSFADQWGEAPDKIREASTVVDEKSKATLTLSPAGGYAATLTPMR
ncbi:glycoside hydrolase family 97 protein [bacterium]|nr:MAG: glycoside hydrolase family 97 protein [bacterium]